MITKQDIETLEKTAISLGVANPFFDEIYFEFGESWDKLPPSYEIEDERLLLKYSKIRNSVRNLGRGRPANYTEIQKF